jgi:hypothetical protein
MKVADVNKLYAEIIERGSWAISGRPGLPGYSLPEFRQFHEYALDSQEDCQLLQQKGVTV